MIDYTRIRGAFRAKAITVAGFPAEADRQWEGRTFTPTTGTGYVREAVLLSPSASQPADMGRGCTIRTEGIYQLTLSWPAGQGTTAVDTVAMAILSAFAPGTVLTNGGVTVKVRRASRATANQKGDRLEVPLSFDWYSDTINPL